MANLEIATLGGGCFWCLEAVFEQLKGVERVVSGYAGGKVAQPSYEQVCGGRTGHAEVVQVYFDPKLISYRDLLNVFFSIHNPTTPNRQGADVGTQYRSAIFYSSLQQKKAAEEAIADFNDKLYQGGIVTEVKALDAFYEAEGYHQGYFRQNGGAPYCQFVIEPKVAKFRKEFLGKLKNMQ